MNQKFFFVLSLITASLICFSSQSSAKAKSGRSPSASKAELLMEIDRIVNPENKFGSVELPKQLSKWNCIGIRYGYEKVGAIPEEAVKEVIEESGFDKDAVLKRIAQKAGDDKMKTYCKSQSFDAVN